MVLKISPTQFEGVAKVTKELMKVVTRGSGVYHVALLKNVADLETRYESGIEVMYETCGTVKELEAAFA
jgi:hypothetical protein